ncbi:MAG: hypothetical protein M4D80_38745 [Myxococcota bacterium]|nr:hypothetical protein [Deltaproteobacteria bacterium]MDQ3341130.1 hypothetical protein [Myxococcota bacterium]
MKWWMLMLVAVLVACGPSTGQVKTAKLAHYTAPSSTLFQIAVEVAERDYKIGEVDEAGTRFATTPQIYSPEGGRQSAGAGGFINMSDRSVMLTLLVEVLPSEPGHVVVVTPKTFQMISGSPKPRELAPDDPNLPGWVSGRVDSLAVAIYDAAKQHAAP